MDKNREAGERESPLELLHRRRKWILLQHRSDMRIIPACLAVADCSCSFLPGGKSLVDGEPYTEAVVCILLNFNVRNSCENCRRSGRVEDGRSGEKPDRLYRRVLSYFHPYTKRDLPAEESKIDIFLMDKRRPSSDNGENVWRP